MYEQLDGNEKAVWSLLVASGYLKILSYESYEDENGFLRTNPKYELALKTFSYFDTGKQPSGAEPERFYHGFVLGLMVELTGRYTITSNRESGFGRYDVMLEPLREEDCAYIFEFKVHDADDEETLHDTVDAALAQIDEKGYETILTSKGILSERICKYGFAFEGKKVLIGA